MVSRATLLAGLDQDIAQAIAQRMAVRGDRVALMGADVPALMLGREKSGIEILNCNLLYRPEIESALADIEDRLGPLDHLVFGTFAPRRQALLNVTTLADWQSTVDVALTAAFNLCQAALRRFTARKQGGLLFILSDYAIIGMRDGAAFTASQTALYSFAKSMAREFAPAGIRVNCLGTGWTPGGPDGEVPMGRPVLPDEVAAVADFLLSDRASYVTGQLLQPNGGRVVW